MPLRTLHVAALLFVSIGSALAAAKQPPRAATTFSPTRASSFLDSLGVNTHIFFGGPVFSAYHDPATAESAIDYLGFHYLRDGSQNITPAQVAKLAEVANKTKIRYDFAMGSGGEFDLAATLKGMHALLAAAPGSIASIEGANEVNNIFHAKTWAVSYKGAKCDLCAHTYGPLVAAQHDLYQAVHADPLLKDIPVYNFSVVALKLNFPVGGCTTDFAADLKNIGDVSATADYGNLHGYPFQGAPPGAYLKNALLKENPVNSKPIAYTETGFSTGEAADANPHLAVSEDVQAKYELDAVLDLYRLGVARTFLYELLDNAPDSPGKDIQQHYGMFYFDGRPKPVAKAFHNLLTILKDDGAQASSFPVTPLALTITQSLQMADRNANEMHVFLQKSDGTNEFLVWGEPMLWNAQQHSQLPAAPPNNVSIKLPQSFKSIDIYDPMVGAAPIRHLTDKQTVEVQVRDHPIVIEFR